MKARLLVLTVIALAVSLLPSPARAMASDAPKAAEAKAAPAEPALVDVDLSPELEAAIRTASGRKQAAAQAAAQTAPVLAAQAADAAYSAEFYRALAEVGLKPSEFVEFAEREISVEGRKVTKLVLVKKVPPAPVPPDPKAAGEKSPAAPPK